MATKKKIKETTATVSAEVSAKAGSAKQDVSQRKSDEVKALQQAEQEKKKAEKQPSGIRTTDGNIIRHAEVKFITKAGIALVTGALYGKLVEGKTGKDAEANLKKIPNHALSNEDYVTYQRMCNSGKAKEALEFAVAKAYPMHVDDRTFNQHVGKVNGNDVDYVTVKLVTKEDVEKGFGFENQIGKMKMLAGIKGSDENRVTAILTDKERAMWRHRAEVEVDEKGNATRIGAPITRLQFAEAVALRQQAQRATRETVLQEAKGIDWSKSAVPVGAKLTRVFPKESDNPNRVWLNGHVNGSPARGVLLSEAETLALREKIATKEQVFMHNPELRKQVYDMNKANYLDLKNNSEAYSAAAIVRRAGDPAAGASFTREEVEVINLHLGKSDDRQAAMTELWKTAEVKIKEAGIDEAWLDSVKDELKDIVSNQWKEKSEGVSVGR